MTAGTRERPGSSGGPVAAESRRRYERPPSRLRGPQWLEGPMTSCHLVLGAGGLLLVIGLVMVFSASAIEAALADQPAWEPGAQQVIWAGLGLVAMVVALRLPVGFIRRWSPIALFGVTFLLLLVLFIGVKLNGARQWFDLGFAHFQPSEAAKLVFALWGAHVIALRERYLTTTSLLVPVVPVFAVLSLLLMLEPDFGAVVTLGLVLVGLLWAGGLPLRYFAGIAAAGALALAAVVTFSPERRERLTSFLDPFADPSEGGFQAIRGMYALATGGFWGVGLGNSAMKWNLLPHAESDYIFAIIGEELGFLGCLVVVALYGVLAYAGFRIARRSADRFIQLASVAITVWLVGQAAMNMGYVVGLLPVTGVQLPLISAGGTSLVLTLFIIGLLVRFARSEPQAIEALRGRSRGRLARILLPAPPSPVDPVRSRRTTVQGGRTLVTARRGILSPLGPREASPDHVGGPRTPLGNAARSVPSRVPPSRRARPAEAPSRRQPPAAGNPRRPGAAR